MHVSVADFSYCKFFIFFLSVPDEIKRKKISLIIGFYQTALCCNDLKVKVLAVYISNVQHGVCREVSCPFIDPRSGTWIGCFFGGGLS